MKKVILLIIISLCTVTVAQENSISKFKFSVANDIKKDVSYIEETYNLKNLTLRANYSLLDFLELGAFCGISSEYSLIGNRDPYAIAEGKNKIVPSYGILANLQLFQLFSLDVSWCDLYVTGQFGAYHKIPNLNNKAEMNTIYKLAPGVRLFPLRRIGVFYEYDLFRNDDMSTGHTYGIVWRF